MKILQSIFFNEQIEPKRTDMDGEIWKPKGSQKP